MILSFRGIAAMDHPVLEETREGHEGLGKPPILLDANYFLIPTVPPSVCVADEASQFALVKRGGGSSQQWNMLILTRPSAHTLVLQILRHTTRYTT